MTKITVTVPNSEAIKQILADVLEGHAEYDSRLCCDGRECGCQASTVFEAIQHYFDKNLATLSQQEAKAVEGDVVGLHPATVDLVDRFALALKEKLLASQNKYGWTDEWMKDDWQERCNHALIEHLAKGDPRDVAAFAAFMWHHSWPTALTKSQDKTAELLRPLEPVLQDVVNDWCAHVQEGGKGQMPPDVEAANTLLHRINASQGESA